MIKYIVAALVLGAAAGYLNNNFFNFFPSGLVSDQLFTATLIVMLFVFGFSFGLDKDSMQKMRKTVQESLRSQFWWLWAVSLAV